MGAAAAVPTGSFCANHPTSAAAWLCRRCGSFLCPACERRVRRDSRPMCPTCWELRQAQVASIAKRGGLEEAGSALAMGVFALVPFPPLQLISLVVCIRALRSVPPAAKWKAWAGLGLTGLGVLLTAALVVIAVLLKDSA